MVTRDQALAAASRILAVTTADKTAADRNGGDPDFDTAHDAALALERLVHDTPERT